MGQRASQLASLYFKDCHLPHDAVLGSEGDGFKHMMMVLEKGRIGIASLSLGISRSALEEVLQLTADRIAAERPDANTQTVQWILADMAADVYAARAMITHASGLKDKGVPANMHASMAKLSASESAGFSPSTYAAVSSPRSIASKSGATIGRNRSCSSMK